MTSDEIKEKIGLIVKAVLEQAGFGEEAKIVVSDTSASTPVFSIESKNDLSILIGRDGQNLQALEHIVRLLVFRANINNQEPINFVVDINNYRKSKSSHIVELARSAAQRVISTKRAEALAPMSAYERRLVHTELAAYKEIQTESIGENPRRRIVIKPLAIE